jgi:hypothetical protein
MNVIKISLLIIIVVLSSYFLSPEFIFESLEKSPTCWAVLVIPSCKRLDRSDLPLPDYRRINRCVRKGQAAAAAIQSGSEDHALTPKLQNVTRITAPSCDTYVK